MNALAAASGHGENAAGEIFFSLLAVFFYFLPSVIGGLRRVRSLGSVIVVNLFLGWTVIGWIIALALAFRSTKPQVTRSASA